MTEYFVPAEAPMHGRHSMIEPVSTTTQYQILIYDTEALLMDIRVFNEDEYNQTRDDIMNRTYPGVPSRDECPVLRVMTEITTNKLEAFH